MQGVFLGCLFICRSAEFGIPVQFFLLVHPLLKRFGHLMSVVVVVLAVERLSDIDPDLPALQAIQRMRVLGSPGPDLVCACDIYGDHGHVGLDGEICRTVLHLCELAGVGSCAFREYEADVALLDLLLGLDETSYGVAVTVDRDASADSHDEAAQAAVVGLKVRSREAAHPLEMSLRKIVYDENAVRITLVVGSDDVRIVRGKVLPADALHVTQKVRKEQEAVLGHNIPESSLGGILLVKMLMVICAGCLLLRSSRCGLRVLLYTLGIVSFGHANTS